MTKFFATSALFLASLGFATAASAAIVTVVAADSGFVTATGATDKFDGLISPAEGNYSVGYELACPFGGLCGSFVPMQRKNYFVFDLSSVTGTIVSASLELFNPVGGYESTEPFETYALGGTTPALVPAVLSKIAAIGAVAFTGEVDDGCGNPTPPPDDPLICEAASLYPLLAGSLGPVGPGPVDLLGPGVLPLALATLTAASDGTVVSILFSPAGVSYLNLFVGSTLVLGGALTTSVPPAPLPQSLFGFSSELTLPAPTLEMTTAVVPIPAALPLLLSAFSLLGLARRKIQAA